MGVVEAVEELGHLVDVLRKQRELEVVDCLPNHFSAAGALKHQLPQIVADLGSGQGVNLLWGEAALASFNLQFVEDLLRSHRGVLQIGTGVTLERESLFEVEGQHPVSGLAGHQVTQGTDRDRPRPVGQVVHRAPFIRALGDGIAGRRGENVEELIRLDSDSAPSGHVDIGLGHRFLGEAEGGTGSFLDEPHGGGRQSHHLVREVDRVVGGLGVAEDADSFLDHLLRVGLPHVDDVVDLAAAAERATGHGLGEIGDRAHQHFRAFSIAHREGRGRLAPPGEGAVAEVVAGAVRIREQPQLPQLVGDVLAGVGNGAVGTHKDLVRIVHIRELRARGQGHYPAALVLAVFLEADGAGVLEQLEGAPPKTEKEDVRLVRQKIVGHPEAGHGGQVATDIRLGHRRGQTCHRAPGEGIAGHHRPSDQLQGRVELEASVARLHHVQDLGSVGGELGLRLVACSHPRVDIPAEIVEVGGGSCRDLLAGGPFHRQLDQFVAAARLHSQGLGELGLGQEEETDHDIRHLDSRVVDVVLDLDLVSEVAQAAHQDVTEHRVAQMPNVGRLVGVDVRVLDDRLSRGIGPAVVLLAQDSGQEDIALQEEVEEAGPGDLDPLDLLGPGGLFGDALRNLTWRPFELAGQGQGPGPRQVPELAPRRHLEHHLLRPVVELGLEGGCQRLSSAFSDRFQRHPSPPLGRGWILLDSNSPRHTPSACRGEFEMDKTTTWQSGPLGVVCGGAGGGGNSPARFQSGRRRWRSISRDVHSSSCSTSLRMKFGSFWPWPRISRPRNTRGSAIRRSKG